MQCRWCDKQLVEVDNPMRREFRHRRGEEALCPGPPCNSTDDCPAFWENHLPGCTRLNWDSNGDLP